MDDAQVFFFIVVFLFVNLTWELSYIIKHKNDNSSVGASLCQVQEGRMTILLACSSRWSMTVLWVFVSDAFVNITYVQLLHTQLLQCSCWPLSSLMCILGEVIRWSRFNKLAKLMTSWQFNWTFNNHCLSISC